MSHTPLRPGVYAPTMTFFNPETEELGPATIRRHAVRLGKAGLVGLVTMGSNGVAAHLTRAERKVVNHETRSALVEAGFANVPVRAGASEQSIHGTIELCHESSDTGAEYALVLPPSYYRTAVGNDETSTSSSRLSRTLHPSPSSCIITRVLWPASTWTQT